MNARYFSFISVIFLIISRSFLYGQETLFFSTYGSSNGDEEMESLIQTSDSGLLIAGTSDTYSSNNDLDLMLLKTGINGNVLWSKRYGGTADDMALDVKETADNGLIIAGWTQSFGAASYDFWILKTDANGNLQWQKRIGGSNEDQAWSVSVDINAYFVVGGTNSYGAGLTDLWAMKLDNNGNILWQNTYGSSGDDAPPGAYDEYAAKGIIDQNGNYLISGTSDGVGHGSTDIYLAKLNPANGNIIWQYAYGNTDEESTWNFVESSSGGYYLPGNTTDPSTYEGDLWVVYVDTSGAIQWQKTFGINNAWDEALNATSLPDGSIVCASYAEQNSSKWIATALKIDVSGNLIWANQYDAGGELEWTNVVIPLNDNTLAFAGVTTNTAIWNEDLTLLRTNNSGKISNCSDISAFTPVVTNTNTTQQPINLTVNNTTVSPINTSASGNNVTVSKNVLCSELISDVNNEFLSDNLIVYPNPAKENITIKFSAIQPEIISILYDQIGQEIERNIWLNTRSLNLSLKGAPGLYFLELYGHKENRILVKILKK